MRITNGTNAFGALIKVDYSDDKQWQRWIEEWVSNLVTKSTTERGVVQKLGGGIRLENEGIPTQETWKRMMRGKRRQSQCGAIGQFQCCPIRWEHRLLKMGWL